jgi:hypothetical protein
MFKIFYAEKDTTLYESNLLANSGLNSVLEVGKSLNTDDTISSINSLLKFNVTEISQSLALYNKSVTDCKFMLQLYTTHARNLAAEYDISAKIVGQSWDNGTGLATALTTDGASWNGPRPNNSWISGSQLQQITAGSNLYISGSGSGGSWIYSSGSATTSSLIVSESFSYRTTDINLDVTNAVKLWLSGSGGYTIPNHGFLLELINTTSTASYGSVQYFSRETHTIYVPKLVMYLDNSTFTTGSLTAVNLDSYVTYTKLKPAYNEAEVAKIRIYSRNKYPVKSATNLFPIETVNYLPTSSFYSILDAATDEVIIPYDNIYTKLSCDSTSNFIHIDMNGFMPERSYRLQLKINDGITIQYINNDTYFKVIR